jgi:hypothetical protein
MDFSQRLIKQNTMKMYGELETFFISELDGREWSASRFHAPATFPSWKEHKIATEQQSGWNPEPV